MRSHPANSSPPSRFPRTCHAPSTADSAGLILVAADGEVRDGSAGQSHESVDPARTLFDVTASGEAQSADTAKAFEYGVLANAAQLVGAGQAMLDASVEYAKQRSQFGRTIGSYQAIKHKLADVYIAVELARPLVYGAALSLADDSDDTARDVSAALVAAADAALLSAPVVAADPRCDRFHAGTRPVAAAAAGAGVAVGMGRPHVASQTGIGGFQ